MMSERGSEAENQREDGNEKPGRLPYSYRPGSSHRGRPSFCFFASPSQRAPQARQRIPDSLVFLPGWLGRPDRTCLGDSCRHPPQFPLSAATMEQQQQQQQQKPAKFHCQFAGCNRSYLRSEHLNRHALIHKKGAFLCYLCQRRFTRNDLLNAHLRRHEKRKSASEGSDAALAPLSPSPSASNNSSNLAVVASSSPSDARSSPATAEWHLEQQQSQDVGRRPAAHFPSMAPLTLPSPSPRSDPAGHIHSGGSSSNSNSNSSSSSHGLHPHGPPQGSMGAVGHLPHLLGQQQQQQQQHHSHQPYLAMPSPFDDYPWLFHSTSLFDLPSDDYLNLHFGNTADHTSPPDIYLPSIGSNSPQHEAPQITALDHERILNHCSDLLNTPLKDHIRMNQILRWALDYCDIYMPFFHRPTLNLSRSPPVLLLALCSLGAFLSRTQEYYEVGKLLHRHVWSQTIEKPLMSARVEMPFIQTLVVLEHICTYAMARHEHEMSEIVHGIIVTLARRNNLMTEGPNREGGSRQSPDVRWREWAQRESVISRIAHTIFVNDVQYMVYFSHHALLSVGMMKIPLPSRQSLWDAPSAVKWEDEMRQLKKTTRSRYFSLDSAVQSILSMKDAEHMREVLHWHSTPSPLSLHILIHGITSAIGDAKYRSVSSSSSLVIRELQRLEFDSALAYWRDQFDQLSGPDQRCQLSWCALVMYDFSAVLLRNNLSDIQMAAGSAFSSGRTVTPQVAQAAYTRLVSTDPVCHDSYLHALEVVGLCIEEGTGNCSVKPGLGVLLSQPISQPRPLWQTYCAFLGLLVLWARALGLENKEQSRNVSRIGLRQFSLQAIPSTAATILANMHHREQAQFSAASVEVQVLKSELRELIGTVSDRLSASSWEISHEAARILTSLVEREGLNYHRRASSLLQASRE
ncbi:hypothetical protein H112_01899 [Trichophyton rubrum D6]|uniref:C2H2-type domain-containing protein n=1 Tax=Trichophyton rubrum CBS 288.86 TaxID=1215330 RepID=A0A022WB10_TRIRU|nr:hypothetical protein H100_01895 [Trichophyton rubrum MR850]EZF44862.1 hypothetical protein H102_01893 [Trichophyton rubrum CBS 100081]EZF55514.1 hypothetical protein H103_01903 [Trichophyton rubrum CBS 288.86]EZF66095.1 hypothetical protein H104_01879 [Trichophyton rubrum CBS 289.86]EZF87449.1 hypothetical protein H110_01901 [Trichophyton rubrum MR1448]EZG19880.1 hypothetical protein H107_01961 [Trichophyton rubrum CBS 202.88]KDB36670.1 hypothetical protein H112_01899 [Trichophyton rubrum 